MKILISPVDIRRFLRLQLLVIISTLWMVQWSLAQAPEHARKYTQVDAKPFADGAGHWYNIFDKHNMINALPGRPQYDPTEITKIADNILLLQKDNGGWPKNYDVFAILTEAQKDSVLAKKNEENTTYDNGSIYTHIAVLANVY